MSHAHSVHDLEQLKKLAKTLLKSAKAGDPRAVIRFAVLGLAPGSNSDDSGSTQSSESPADESGTDSVSHDGNRQLKLADAQLVIARERGFESWKKLRRFIEEHVADDFFAAVAEGRLRKVKLLLHEFPKLSLVREDASGLLPIQVAIRFGHQDIQRLLLDIAKPQSLNTSKFLPFENGKGHEIWDTINSAITGNLERIRSLIEKSPSLVNCYYDYQTPLHLAVVHGHADVAEYLLQHGADVAVGNYLFHDSLVTSARERQNWPLAELLTAAMRKRFPHYALGPHVILGDVTTGDQTVVRSKLSTSPEQANVCAEDGNTPLHLAAKNLNIDMAKLLLDHGADANSANKVGFKPIHVALYRNNYWFHRDDGWEFAEFLLPHTEPNINLAATFGNVELVREFLRNDPKLANFCASCNKRPISSAAAQGDVEVVKLLLDAGADPRLAEANAPNGFALWAAAHGGHLDCARLLLDAGASPHDPVESCGTAFSIAEGNETMLELFRQYGRELTKPDPEENDGLDPVSGAIMRNDIAQLRRYLDEVPTLVRNPSAFYGEGYLALAVSRRRMEIVDLLLERGARVPDQSNWGSAYAFKHTEVARKLLEHGANPNHRNWLQRTILHEFAYRGDIEKVKLLIEFDANLNAVDMEYQSTPLGFAARGGKLEVVKVLLNAGADPNLPSSPAWAKPIAWARARGHAEVERALQ